MLSGMDWELDPLVDDGAPDEDDDEDYEPDDEDDEE